MDTESSVKPTVASLKATLNNFVKGKNRLRVGFQNLKKIHHTLNEEDPFALAYMALNPSITEQEKNMLLEMLREKCAEGIIL